MGIDSTANRNNYVGNDATSVYSYSFKINSEDHLKVTVNDTNGNETTLTKITDYTVSGVLDAGGGNVTLVDASQSWLDDDGNLKQDYLLTIRRVVPLLQETDLRNQSDFHATTHEDAFDYAMMADQQQQDELDRSCKNPETISSTEFDPTLPSNVNTPLYYLQVNPDGDGFRMVQNVAERVSVGAGTGIMVKDTESSAIVRSITGESGVITVTNGDGVSGNPVIDIADDAIDTDKIQDGAVTLDKLSAAALSSFVPVGTVIESACDSAPDGYLYCNGASLSRTTYADLFAAIGTAYGAADANSFNIPDRRGVFGRGVDDGAGNDPDAASRTATNTGGNTGDNIGSEQADATAGPSNSFTTNTTGSHSHSYSATDNAALLSGRDGGFGTDTVGVATVSGAIQSSGSHSHSITGGDNETRPVNLGFKYYIKY